MLIPIHPEVRDMSRLMSVYKTPELRTKGFAEQEGEIRGNGDVVDTIASLTMMLWLCEQGLPVVYEFTANRGDDTDIRVGNQGGRLITINVKSSTFDAYAGEPTGYHLAVKEEELEKDLPNVFAQVFVHDDHVHLCGWCSTKSSMFSEQTIKTIPGTGGHQGLWIHERHLASIDLLVPSLQKAICR